MRKKVMIVISILLLVALSAVFFILPSDDSTEIIQENNETAPNEMEDDPAADDDESETGVADEIKEKVKQVVGDTIELFIKDDLNIVAIGDSLTQGVGDENDNEGYVGVLRSTLNNNDKNIKIDNFGKRGNRSDQLLNRLDDPDIVDAIDKADIVLVTIGANDIMKVVQNNFTNLREEPFNQERVAYVERLHDIFDKMIEINPNTEIFLVGFYNPFEKYFGDIEQLGIILNNWNVAGEKVTETYDQIKFIPTIDIFQTNQNLLSDDNFHPNSTGYRLMADRVLNYLRPSIIESE